jgi:RNA polymerase sigma-70 factor, ECF subfamily
MHAETVSSPAALAPDLSRDADLVRAVRAKDPRAMELFIRRHNRAMYRTARAILRDDAEAEDAVQDAYLRALSALDSFRGDSTLSTWLVRIAANEALMRRRRDVRRAVVIPLVDVDLAVVENVRDDAPDAEQKAANAQLRGVLEKRIDALPDLYRAVFVMRAVEEMSVEETALALGLPEATVRTRFFRARGLLRAAIEQDLDQATLEVFAFDGERCDRIVRSVLERFAATP